MVGAIQILKKEVSEQVEDARQGEIVRDGIHVAIVGPPNAGKSSLLNSMGKSHYPPPIIMFDSPWVLFSSAKRQAAIVSEIPGTTRDVVEVSMNINGLKCILSDTAGLRQSQDIIEQEGIRRARER